MAVMFGNFGKHGNTVDGGRIHGISIAEAKCENRNVSALPDAAEEHEKLAKRLGYKNLDLFTTEYRAARETIRSLYERYIKNQIT